MRTSALVLAGHLCSLCGVQWTLGSGNSKLFRLLANLAAVVCLKLVYSDAISMMTHQEMRLCLEESQGLASLQSHLLCSCCIILESSVAFSASQSTTSTGLWEKKLCVDFFPLFLQY